MAIIYTYPRLTSPQGNELIVVSDVNNKNATRLVTIDSIASLVPGDGVGCSTSISSIVTPDGTFTTSSCDSPVSFDSSDQSIEISHTGNNIIDFTSNGVVTYVLKPVICSDQGQNPSRNASEWIFSSNSDLSQAADTGSAINLTNNNLPVQSEYNSCWIVETWRPIPVLDSDACCVTPPFSGIYSICSTNPNALGSCANMPNTLVLSPTNGNLPSEILATKTDTGDQCCYTLQDSGNVEQSVGYSYESLDEDQNCNTTPCVASVFTNRYSLCSADSSSVFGAPKEIYLDADATSNMEFIRVSIPDSHDAKICYFRTATNTSEPATPNQSYEWINETEVDCDKIVELGYCTTRVQRFQRCGDPESTLNVLDLGQFQINSVYNLTFAAGVQPGTGVERSDFNGCWTCIGSLYDQVDGKPSSATQLETCDEAVCQEGQQKWVYYECGALNRN